MATTGTAGGNELAVWADQVSMHGAKAAEELAKAVSGAVAADYFDKGIPDPRNGPPGTPCGISANELLP